MAKRKPADMGSEEQTTRKKDPREAEVGEKPARKKTKLSLAEALELLEKPAPKGSEGQTQTTRKKDSREAEVGEKPAKKKAKLSLAEALELLEKPAPKGSEGQTTRKKDSREADVGEKPARKNAKTSKMTKQKGASTSGSRRAAKALEMSKKLASKGREGHTTRKNCFLKRTLYPSGYKGPDVGEKSARKADNSKDLLYKLPPEVWEKILGELENDDLFPLALSCRFFRQKQKELVARRTQQGRESGKSPLALKTTLFQKREKGQLVSSEYIRFCSEENARGYQIQKSDPYETFHHPDEVREWYLMCLAAFHGHLHLLNQSALSGRAFDNYGGCGEYGEYGEYDEYGEFQEDYEYGVFYGGDYSEGEENEERGYYLQTLFDPEGESISVYAARGGQLETLKWQKTRNGFKLHEELIDEACKGGHLEIVKWLRDEDCPWDERACTGAAHCGHLKTLKWLRSEGCPWSADVCNTAAWGGHLDVLKWLRSEGCPWDAGACSYAAQGGHFELLKWLRRKGCPWNERACQSAAEGGRLAILKWLRSKGCPWNAETCTFAAQSGHLDVLQWAIDNGCPYTVNGKTRPALKSLGII